MLTIDIREDGTIALTGRFDASEVPRAEQAFGKVTETCHVDMKDLDYISSAGLGVLLMTQKRLGQKGQALVLKNMNKMIRDVFRIARFDMLFKIE